MWIRSQDKANLVNAKRLEIVIVQGNFHRIVCPDYEEYVELGTYSFKEKALKVLDMIQEAIQHGTIVKKTEKFDVCRETVFEMPQDEEV